MIGRGDTICDMVGSSHCQDEEEREGCSVVTPDDRGLTRGGGGGAKCDTGALSCG
jgi:hypothetical protein